MKVLLLLAVLADANAPVSQNVLLCDLVKGYVAMYGEAAAIKWAENHKWSKARIAEARACLVR